MSKVNSDTIRKVADLSKIHIAADKESHYAAMLETALSPVEEFGDLSLADVDTLSHPGGLTTDGEPDEFVPGLEQSEALQNAAAGGNVILGYIKVPIVIK